MCVLNAFLICILCLRSDPCDMFFVCVAKIEEMTVEDNGPGVGGVLILAETQDMDGFPPDQQSVVDAMDSEIFAEKQLEDGNVPAVGLQHPERAAGLVPNLEKKTLHSVVE